jgi:hypothetical protein
VVASDEIPPRAGREKYHPSPIKAFPMIRCSLENQFFVFGPKGGAIVGEKLVGDAGQRIFPLEAASKAICCLLGFV